MSAYHENALQPDSALAEYTIESVLGYGGFSITYLAHDTSLGAHVAIKEYLPQEIAGRDEGTAFVIPRASKDAIRHYHWGLKNFVKEARALARFKHPNIVRVLRFIEANGTAYTVMEYEEGQTLAAYLKDTGQLDESNLLRIVMPILNGLHAVHEVGLLHLDIKPENIYLRQDGSPMLIDFGSARQAMTESRPTGRITLTHGYAPVEQYPDKGKLGPWSDVYAMGATMYRCITGKRPDDSLERYRAVLDYKTDPLKPATLAAAGRYRPVILECIDRAMQIYAKERPQSARELQDALLGRGTKSTRTGTNTGPATFKPGIAKPTPVRRREDKSAGRDIRPIHVIVASIVAVALVGWLLGADIVGFLQNTFWSFSGTTPSAETAPRPSPVERPAPAEKVKEKLAATQPAPRMLPPSMLHRSLTGHRDWIQAVTFAPSGGRVVTASTDRTVRIWDAESGAALAVIKPLHTVNAIDYSPDGRTLATVGADGILQLWDATSGAAGARLEGGSYPLFAVAFSRDGRSVSAGGKDRAVFVWSLANSSRRAFEGHAGDVNALAFAPDGKLLASASADRSVRLWDTASGQEIATLSGHKSTVLSLAFSPDGRWLASGDAGDVVRLWDVRSQAHVRTLTDAKQAIMALAFARDSSWLAAGSADNSVYIYEVESGNLLHTLSGHTGYVQAIAVSPDGRWLASGSRDQSVRLWHAAAK